MEKVGSKRHVSHVLMPAMQQCKAEFSSCCVPCALSKAESAHSIAQQCGALWPESIVSTADTGYDLKTWIWCISKKRGGAFIRQICYCLSLPLIIIQKGMGLPAWVIFVLCYIQEDSKGSLIPSSSEKLQISWACTPHADWPLCSQCRVLMPASSMQNRRGSGGIYAVKQCFFMQSAMPPTHIACL